LDTGRYCDHKANELLLDCHDFIFREFVGENPGFVSSALRAISAVLVRKKLDKNFDHARLTLFMLPMI